MSEYLQHNHRRPPYTRRVRRAFLYMVLALAFLGLYGAAHTVLQQVGVVSGIELASFVIALMVAFGIAYLLILLKESDHSRTFKAAVVATVGAILVTAAIIIAQ